MTPSEKQALRALCEKAPDVIELVMRGSGYLSYQDPSDEAKAFYQRARSALPELLDECERKDFVLAGIQERFDAQCSELAALKAECESLKAALPREDEIDSVMSLLNWTRAKHDKDSAARQWLERVVAASLRQKADSK